MWPASLNGLSMVMKKKKVRPGTLGTVGDRVKSIRQELGLIDEQVENWKQTNIKPDNT
jgi:hypothetical protein